VNPAAKQTMYSTSPGEADRGSATGEDLFSRRKLSFSSQVLPGIIAGLDSLAVLSTAIVLFLTLIGSQVEDAGYYAAAICFVWVVSGLLMNFGGLYRLDPIMSPLIYVDKIIVAFGATFLFLLAAAFSLKISTTFSRVWVSSFAAAACGSTLLIRIFAARVVGYFADRRVFTRNVVIAGAGEQAQQLFNYIGKCNPRFFTVLGVFSEKGSDSKFCPYPIFDNLDNLPSYIRAQKVDDVIIALPWSSDDKIVGLMMKLRELPVNVYLSSDLIGFRLPFRQSPDHFGEMPLVEVMGQPLQGWGFLGKAALDYGLGAVLTLLLLPAMVIIAMAIKLDSSGPILFRQQRYGFVNKVFLIWKFRTMRHEPIPPNGTAQATRNDPRVTWIGRILRKTSLDELPQLFNVLGGTMSLVGPRPHASDHNEEYAQLIRGYFARHRVKPGITGWAQVNGFRGETRSVGQMEARVKYDVDYVENWSLLFDLKILAMTVFAAISGRNAY
jgi:putative colanic acid biosysnthesis UDP-glucose lipid carrier transferase